MAAVDWSLPFILPYDLVDEQGGDTVQIDWHNQMNAQVSLPVNISSQSKQYSWSEYITGETSSSQHYLYKSRALWDDALVDLPKTT